MRHFGAIGATLTVLLTPILAVAQDSGPDGRMSFGASILDMMRARDAVPAAPPTVADPVAPVTPSVQPRPVQPRPVQPRPAQPPPETVDVAVPDAPAPPPREAPAFGAATATRSASGLSILDVIQRSRRDEALALESTPRPEPSVTVVPDLPAVMPPRLDDVSPPVSDAAGLSDPAPPRQGPVASMLERIVQSQRDDRVDTGEAGDSALAMGQALAPEATMAAPAEEEPPPGPDAAGVRSTAQDEPSLAGASAPSAREMLWQCQRGTFLDCFRSWHDDGTQHARIHEAETPRPDVAAPMPNLQPAPASPEAETITPAPVGTPVATAEPDQHVLDILGLRPYPLQQHGTKVAVELPPIRPKPKPPVPAVVTALPEIFETAPPNQRVLDILGLRPYPSLTEGPDVAHAQPDPAPATEMKSDKAAHAPLASTLPEDFATAPPDKRVLEILGLAPYPPLDQGPDLAALQDTSEPLGPETSAQLALEPSAAAPPPPAPLDASAPSVAVPVPSAPVTMASAPPPATGPLRIGPEPHLWQPIQPPVQTPLGQGPPPSVAGPVGTDPLVSALQDAIRDLNLEQRFQLRGGAEPGSLVLDVQE